ncbi:MAG: YdcF family protein [Clostridia bacterium]|nr:YdcF family protein [Clostridia bacterium]
MKIGRLRKAVAIILALLIIIFMMPIFMGILHIGMIYPTLLFLLLLFIDLFPQKFKLLFNCKLKILTWIITVGISLGVVLTSVVLITMGVYAAKPPEKNATVIVLGCQVRGSTPSKMLYDRMNAALKYLNENPDSACVASGGQGENEDISEAQAIYNYLTENGIESSRIYLEDKSVRTSENISFSAKVIKDNNLSKNVVIASDNFHQLRSSIFAEKNGLSATPLGCPTFPTLVAPYWTREVLAVIKAVILGY